MALKTYDTKDAVPEAQRAAAIETADKKWIVEEPADTSKADEAIRKIRDEKKAAEDKLKAAEKERDDLKREKDAAAKGISAEELQKIRDEEAKKLKPVEDERDALKLENRKLKLRDRARAEAIKHGMIEERLDEDVMDAIEKRLDLASDGTTIVVKDKKGNVTSDTLDTFFTKTYKGEKAYLYKGPGGSGSGADASGTGGEAGDGEQQAREAGKKAAAAQKQSATENKLAFT